MKVLVSPFTFLFSIYFLVSTAWGAPPLEIGIDRSGLAQQGEPVLIKTLSDIRTLGAGWFRDVLNSGSPQSIAALVDEMKIAKARQLKFLLNVVQLDEDYPDNNSAAAKNSCGWREKHISQVDMGRYKSRIRNTFQAIKTAGLSLDAVEVGNEDDTYCYNADIPTGHQASDSELRVAASGYGRFLRGSAEAVREYFPHAKIITFGIAHGSDQWDKIPKHLTHPARLIALLRTVDGFNYLDNSEYHVDGIGTHIYPWANGISEDAHRMLQEDISLVGKDKPFWLTEWGFLDKSKFPNKQGLSLAAAMEQLLGVFEAVQAHWGVSLGPVFFYSYNGWLADSQLHLLPESKVISQYTSR